MEKLKTWIKRRGYTLVLEPGVDDRVECEDVKKVHLNSRQGKNSLLSLFLHECGHILIYEARSKQTSVKARPIAGCNRRDYLSNKRRYGKNTCKRKVAIVTEEIEAWERGWELGRRLSIRLSKQKFENVRIKALMTYMRWSAVRNKKRKK